MFQATEARLESPDGQQGKMMRPRLNETTEFRQWRTLDGSAEPVDLIRRNKQLVPRYSPAVTEPPAVDRGELKRLLREVMYELTPCERRTWLLLMLGFSIVETARKERVSRTAIYERIRGNSKGQGGMIRKNDYVRIWWERRKDLHPNS